MDKNFDSLLKTENENIETSQVSEDVFKISKQMIKKMCVAFCLPASQYNPSKTVLAIRKYINVKPSKARILYSEISSYVYALQTKEQGNFATNIDCLLSYVFEENMSVEEEICKIVIKIYDHFQLAVLQKNLNIETKEIFNSHLSESIAEANEAIEKSSEKAKNAEKEYITILGIFASIVLAFVGGLTFSTSVLQNIDSISIYRLLLVIDLIALVIVNAIYLLMKFICYINGKTDSQITVKWFNIVGTIVCGVIIISWIFDAISFVEFIRSHMPW